MKGPCQIQPQQALILGHFVELEYLQLCLSAKDM